MKDLRWNNVGLLGGRAALESIQNNFIVQEVDVSGNEVPDDITRAIAVILHRNKEKEFALRKTKENADHLYHTLDTLARNHQSAIEQMSSKLSASDSKSVSVSEKLSRTQADLNVVSEAKMTAEKRVASLEKELGEMKANSGLRLSQLQNELGLEKEKRQNAEEVFAKKESLSNLRILELEASLRETEIKTEVVRRDKSVLLEELQKLKDREHNLQEHHTEKLRRMEMAHQGRLTELEDAKNAEQTERTRKFEERLRQLEESKTRIAEELDSTKERHIREKRGLMDAMADLEVKMRKEEESKRKELESELEKIKSARDQAQSDLQSLIKQHQAAMRDHENEQQRLREQKSALSEELSSIKAVNFELHSENQSQKHRLDETNRREQNMDKKISELLIEVGELKDKCDHYRNQIKALAEEQTAAIKVKNEMIAKLKDEIKRLEFELTEERNDQSLQMKELSAQISSLISQRRRHIRSASTEIACSASIFCSDKVAVHKMGIHGLTKVIADYAPNAVKDMPITACFGRKVAIDASMSIYQFLIAVRQQDGNQLMNEAGDVTSHLMGILYRTVRMCENGIKPLYVFDGKPPELKLNELKKRGVRRDDAEKAVAKAVEEGKCLVHFLEFHFVISNLVDPGDVESFDKFSRRTVKVTREQNDECKRLLKLMGVPYVEAPGEAEAQCAALAKSEKVYAAGSEDMDTLTFGAPYLMRHLTFSEQRKMPVSEIDLSKVLEGLQMNMDQFIDMCILLGCDYCDSIKGIGPMRAVSLIREHKSIENILKTLDKTKYPVPEDWPYKEAREYFKKPKVMEDTNLDIKWTDPDEEGIVEFLVKEKSFNEDRVRGAVKKLAGAKTPAAKAGAGKRKPTEQATKGGSKKIAKKK
ncbi:Elongation of fatty acids protein 2 [Blyttiomyces sp. JEL0837]|nr:Elongation of fatty acids protein 2 [Blyttiomyces sp. JEL0837]